MKASFLVKPPVAAWMDPRGKVDPPANQGVSAYEADEVPGSL